MNASDLWQEGANPIDLVSARLLWKSPWWAHVLESRSEIQLSEADFIAVLCRLYRDFTKFHGRKLTLEEFADLASMARKVRWKNPGRFGFKISGIMRKKLSLLTWNPETARFKLHSHLDLRLRPPAPVDGWKNMNGKQRRRFGAKIRKWKKAHREERSQQAEEDKSRFSQNISAALQ
jgi:hypothetical protein